MKNAIDPAMHSAEHILNQATTGEIGRCRITTASFTNGVLRIRYKLDRPRAVNTA